MEVGNWHCSHARDAPGSLSANTEQQDVLEGLVKANCGCTVEDNIDPGQKLLLVFSTDGQLGLSEFSINRLNLLVEIRAIFSDPVKDLEAQTERDQVQN